MSLLKDRIKVELTGIQEGQRTSVKAFHIVCVFICVFVFTSNQKMTEKYYLNQNIKLICNTIALFKNDSGCISA